MPKLAIPLNAALLAVFINVLWGGNPVAVKVALEWIPPLWTGFFRFLLGILTVAAYATWRRIPLWPTAAEWKPLTILAFVFALQITVMNHSYDMTPASVAVVVQSTFPLFVALMAHFYVENDRLRPAKSLGLLVAFVGVAATILRETGVGGGGWLGFGPLLVLLSSVMLAGRIVFSANLVRSIDPVKVTIWQMILSLPYFLIGGLAFEQIQWQNFGLGPLLGILFQGVVIAGFGFVVAITLPKYYNPSIVTSIGFLTPVSGVLLAMWLLGEPLSWQLVVGTVAVGLGLYLIVRQPREKPS
ncbi:MAG: DMT family transporter [Alphaproteobacteria bacterium]|nr:DMT family transporter [Alphaproteobacteria bacterium]